MNSTDILKKAEKQLLKYGEHPPTVFACFEGLHPVQRIIRSFPRTAEQRQHALFLEGKRLGEQYSSRTIKSVWFVHEAWMSLYDLHTGYTVPPSQDPKRREVLVMVELDAQTLLQTGELREMRRNAKKKLISLRLLPETLSLDTDVVVSGPLVLSLLAGFAENATPFPARRALHAKILQERVWIDRLIEKRDHEPF